MCVLEREREREKREEREYRWVGWTDRWMEGYTYIYHILYNTIFDKKRSSLQMRN